MSAWCVCVCVCFRPQPPPLMFIAGSHGWEAVNPRWIDIGNQCHAYTWPVEGGGAHWAVGRPTTPGPQPPPTTGGSACLGLLLSKQGGTPCPKLVHLGSWVTLGPIDLELVLWIYLWFYLGLKCAYNLQISSKNILQFSKGKVWLGIYLIDNACKKCKLSWFSDQVDA